ncbi:LPXTG cell wall anchor domain-containing protein [Arsenicicoccus sp. oral taxon 190]|uniref:LPXTG cell wall anchor domain-containing protein n=1 Tax=Arsenicicoccus sp. oral taxon 190 TaxID=1658671 RepID=UPI00067A3F03|nr:LPXTG cell wall anchor domain-containing protein [Arsenicicoccus sp. oral taxon 190]AKT50413.1 hypothetical protein ADJ73_02110 [Arsenicicoccus sp. oral taxon 190]
MARSTQSRQQAVVASFIAPLIVQLWIFGQLIRTGSDPIWLVLLGAAMASLVGAALWTTRQVRRDAQPARG